MKLIEITYEEVQNLRDKGMRLEAKEMLQAHYRDIKKARKNMSDDIKKHNRMIGKTQNLCINCFLRKSIAKNYCKICISHRYDKCLCGELKGITAEMCHSCYKESGKQKLTIKKMATTKIIQTSNKYLQLIKDLKPDKIYSCKQLKSIFMSKDVPEIYIYNILATMTKYEFLNKISHGKYQKNETKKS